MKWNGTINVFKSTESKLTVMKFHIGRNTYWNLYK
jgi:hypothetical protein